MPNTARPRVVQPIENYGVIGNMRSIALVSVEGSIDFLCYPEFDSPTVFAALLDPERGGSFDLHPDLGQTRIKQLYLPSTNILLTRFLSESGVAELADFMPVNRGGQRYGNHIVRHLRVIKGRMSFEMRCAPRFDYARSGHKIQRERTAVVFVPDRANVPAMALRATVPLDVDGPDVRASFELGAGEVVTMTFGEVSDAERPFGVELDSDLVEERFRETSRFWRDWVAQSNYTGRWREMVDRSALVLKLLNNAEHGSVIAAATFGLPERIGGERNWDYRYAWLRDSSFSMYALMRLGFVDEARGFARWIRQRTREDSENGPLQVMYHVDGRQELDEQIRCPATPVRSRCASATPRIDNCSSTSTARSPTPSISTTNTATASRTTTGTRSNASSSGWPRIGGAPTRAFGKSAAASGNSCIRD
jgi:GH15 family glucan-1,4-alpha-glucosidase